jgi:hypothetical protein
VVKVGPDSPVGSVVYEYRLGRRVGGERASERERVSAGAHRRGSHLRVEVPVTTAEKESAVPTTPVTCA